MSRPDLPCLLCQNCKINPKIAKYFKIVKLHQNCQINPDLNKLTNYPTVVELPQNCQKPDLALNYCKIVRNLNWPHLDLKCIRSLCCHIDGLQVMGHMWAKGGSWIYS